MAIRVNTGNYKPGEGDGDTLRKPGLYHFCCTRVIEANEKGNLEVHISVVDGESTDEKGKGLRCHIKHSNQKNLRLWAVALGLASAEIWVQAAGDDVEINFEEGVGRHFCGLCEKGDDYDGKETVDLAPWNVFPLQSPRAKGVRINWEAAKENGGANGSPTFGSPKGNDNGSTTQPPEDDPPATSQSGSQLPF